MSLSGSVDILKPGSCFCSPRLQTRGVLFAIGKQTLVPVRPGRATISGLHFSKIHGFIQDVNRAASPKTSITAFYTYSYATHPGHNSWLRLAALPGAQSVSCN